MHDVIIIGAGPGGVSAALWCEELGLDTLLLEQSSEIGGQLRSVYNPIENYPGVRFEDGAEFASKLAEQTEQAEFDVWTQVELEAVDLRAKRISLRSDEQLKAIAIVIATGVRRRALGIPGETEFVGRGIIESGTRDREQFAGRDVCVVGGGNRLHG